jgi:hypothetical protein
MFFNKDLLILFSAWVVTIIMLILFIPKSKIREAQLVFLFKMSITWLIGLLVVEFRLIEYPVEFFKYATKTSFTFEYFVFPSICAVFNLNFPDYKSNLIKFMHYFYFCTTMTIMEVLCEKYTNIIEYIHWSWYLTWITLFITFFISRNYYVWFFRLRDTKQELSCVPSGSEKDH